MTLTATIPSYLYQQYNDDETLQAFVDAYNQMAQQYVDWFNEIELPVYTGLSGDLLDWVALGLYGIRRPALPFGVAHTIGPLNTWAYNTIALNTLVTLDGEFGGGIGLFSISITPIGGYPVDGGGRNDFVTSDDTFKRVITWAFFKGDGKVFNIRWLKRRVMRFLQGVDGINYNVDETYRISVSFGVGNQVNIRILSSITTVLGSAAYNSFAFNTTALNVFEISSVPLTPFAMAPILQAAIQSGALELPFQFDYVVSI